MSTTLKVTAKGQVTLRRELLEHLGVAPGDKVVVEFLPSGRAEVRAARSLTTIDDFIGCLEKPGTSPLSINEMNEIIAEAWAGKR